MHVDPSQSPSLFELASEKLGGHFRHERGDKVLSLLGQHGVAAQFVFSNVTPGAKCELSAWSDPERRGLGGRVLIRNAFDVAFRQWRCERVHAVARESNETSWRALMDMGFKFEAPMAWWFHDPVEDGWMFRMLRHECPWLQTERR